MELAEVDESSEIEDVVAPAVDMNLESNCCLKSCRLEIDSSLAVFPDAAEAAVALESSAAYFLEEADKEA